MPVEELQKIIDKAEEMRRKAKTTMGPTAEPLAIDVPELKEWGGPGRTVAFAEIKAGRLKAKKMGRRTIVRLVDLREYLEALPAAGGNAE